MAIWMAGGAPAAELSCPGGKVLAQSDDAALLPQICNAAEAAFDHFASCDLPTLPDPVRIVARTRLDADCLGLYHCGERLIEVLTPDRLDVMRADLKLLGGLEVSHLFESVVLHELAHALYDQTPCPYDTCVATSEYFAYVVQIAAMTDEERASAFAGTDMSEKVTRDAINPFILFMAPHRFATLAWLHSGARDGRCAYLNQIVEGAIVFDRERP